MEIVPLEETANHCIYSLDTYRDRFWHFMHVCGPLAWPKLLTSEEQLAKANAVVEACKKGVFKGGPLEVKNAYRTAAAVLHPDTRDPIQLPFRMAAHVPANTVLLVGMLSARSPLAHAFWQFSNQSFNALQFFANRNRSNTVSKRDFLTSYFVAVFGSIGTAVGLSKLANALPGKWGLIGTAMVPFLAVSITKPLQIGLMRMDELRRGVNVAKDEEGVEVIGRSKKAGRLGLMLTISSRIAYLMQPMLLPPLLMALLRNWAPMAASRLLRNSIFVGFTGLNSAIATPMCMALYKPTTAVSAAKLERHIQDAVEEGVEVYFNKGL